MNILIGLGSLLALVIAVVALFFIRHHNARAVLFVTLFTCGVIGLGLSVAFVSSKETSTLRIKPIEIFDITQYTSWQTPDVELLVAALIATIFIALIAVLFEIVVVYTNNNPIKNSLKPVPKNFRQHPAFSSKIVITVLIPAHNEELSLPHTLASLTAQTRPPDRIIVVADNCTDGTVKIARDLGHQVIESVNNTHRKAGALNQTLAQILPEMGRQDVVMVMDADSQINKTFLESAADYFQKFPSLDAVGGVFYGEPGSGLLGQFQRNEYFRYSDQIRRRSGRVFVLTGTASLFRSDALIAVAESRGVHIPGEHGQVYDTAALTEDNELTIALKTLGCPMISPPECVVTTEIMPTWRNLWIQRLRWQRGAVENLGAYGFTRTTMRYWGQQIGIAYGTIALFSAMAISLFMFLAEDQFVWYTFWVGAGLIFSFERIWTVKKGGRSAILLALPVFPEIAFDIFLQAVFVRVLIDTAIKRRTSWGHVKRTELLSKEGI
jgi:cellulose synthase/poly-beta-1,6-N-acetylglucosamine synthase-like glycosyltransferase